MKGQSRLSKPSSDRLKKSGKNCSSSESSELLDFQPPENSNVLALDMEVSELLKKDSTDLGAVKPNSWTFVSPTRPVYRDLITESTDNITDPFYTAASHAFETDGSSDVTPLSSSTKVMNITDWFSLETPFESGTVASSDHPTPMSSSSTITEEVSKSLPFLRQLESLLMKVLLLYRPELVVYLDVTDLSSPASFLALETVDSTSNFSSVSPSTDVVNEMGSLSPATLLAPAAVASANTIPPPSSTEIEVIKWHNIPPSSSTEIKNVTDSLTWATSLAVETVASSEPIPSSMNTESIQQKVAIASTNQSGAMKSETVKCNAFAELIMKHRNQLQKLDARDICLPPKRVLDVVISSCKRFIQLLQDNQNESGKVLTLGDLNGRRKVVKIAVVSFMVLAWYSISSFDSASQSSFNAIPPPT